MPIVFISVIFFSLGMAEAPQDSPEATSQLDTTKGDLESFLADLEVAYESRSVSNVSSLLDRDFERLLDFKSNLQDYYLNYRNLQIHFVIDTYLTDRDRISVRLHWFKKTMDSAGTFAKVRGESEFAFKRDPEGLRLIYIRGDNPFF
jgi:hypothetical protein